jgi:hypothetical protein
MPAEKLSMRKMREALVGELGLLLVVLRGGALGAQGAVVNSVAGSCQPPDLWPGRPWMRN